LSPTPTAAAPPPPPGGTPPRPPEAPVTPPEKPPKTDLGPPPGFSDTATQQRNKIGSDLAVLLLKVVATSIIILVAYLVILDWVTSKEVTQVYDHTLQHLRAAPVAQDVSGVADTARLMNDASGSPSSALSAIERTKMLDVIAELRKSNRVNTPNAAKLDRCVALFAKSETPAAPQTNPAGAKPPAPAVIQPPVGTKQPGADSKQPPAVPKQPDADSKQPPAGTNQPGTDTKQPGAGAGELGPEKPVALKKKSTRRATRKAAAAASAAALAATAAKAKQQDPPQPKKDDPAAERI
jgi:hypothetical protein